MKNGTLIFIHVECMRFVVCTLIKLNLCKAFTFDEVKFSRSLRPIVERMKNE